VSRSMESQGDVTRARETVEALQQQFNDLQAQFDAEANELASQIDPLTEELMTIEIKPKKADISVQLVALVWVPHWKDPEGALTIAL
jgi:translation initiation factor 2B subunit (eIF-2B alpha/beta/delta family)